MTGYSTNAYSLMGEASGAHTWSDFDYDYQTNVVTITFPKLADDLYTFRIATQADDGYTLFTDNAGNLLDGDGDGRRWWRLC